MVIYDPVTMPMVALSAVDLPAGFHSQVAINAIEVIQIHMNLKNSYDRFRD